MKNILVTGANGLLGTNVIHALVATGYNATGLLRRKDSFRGALSDSLKLVEGDITSQADVMRAAAPTYSLTEALNIPETNPGNPFRRFRNPDMY